MTAHTARRFTPEEIVEILGLHAEMSASQIARLFQAEPNTIQKIVTGRTYRSVTCVGHQANKKGRPCRCSRCAVVTRAARNLEIIRETTVSVPCFFCGRTSYTSVHNGLTHKGEIACALHGGRKA